MIDMKFASLRGVTTEYLKNILLVTLASRGCSGKSRRAGTVESNISLFYLPISNIICQDTVVFLQAIWHSSFKAWCLHDNTKKCHFQRWSYGYMLTDVYVTRPLPSVQGDPVMEENWFAVLSPKLTAALVMSVVPSHQVCLPLLQIL